MRSKRVLVVPTKKLYEKGEWNGFRQRPLRWYLQLVQKEGQFIDRAQAEEDLRYKQIISQVLFTHKRKVFLHRITPKGGESRLHAKYPIFIGGHVDDADLTARSPLASAVRREFAEEVEYKGRIMRRKFVGLVNETTVPVNRVHVGFVYIFEGGSDDIHVREDELEEVGLLSLSELKSYVPQMTYWSQLVYPQLSGLI